MCTQTRCWQGPAAGPILPVYPILPQWVIASCLVSNLIPSIIQDGLFPGMLYRSRNVCKITILKIYVLIYAAFCCTFSLVCICREEEKEKHKIQHLCILQGKSWWIVCCWWRYAKSTAYSIDLYMHLHFACPSLIFLPHAKQEAFSGSSHLFVVCLCGSTNSRMWFRNGVLCQKVTQINTHLCRKDTYEVCIYIPA